MFATGTGHAEKFVSNRRMQEDRINTLQTKLKQEFQMKELAKFENKGKMLLRQIISNNVWLT